MIRRAIPDDAPALAALHADSFAKMWSVDEFRALLHDPAVMSFVAPKGFVLVRRAADEAEILTICVENAVRGSQLGVALLRRAAAALHAAGATTLFLEVSLANAPARRLYAKLGFEEAGRRRAYYGPSEDALILRAPLPLGNATRSTNIASAKQGRSRDAD